MKNFTLTANINDRRLREYLSLLKNNSSFIMMYILFISGLILGTTISNISSLLNNFFFMINIEYNNILQVFFGSLILYITVHIYLFISGLCTVGKPFIISAPFMIGAYYGCLFSCFYKNFYTNGIMYYILLKVPGSIIFINTVFLATEIAKQMSTELNYIVAVNARNVFQIKNYIKKFIILAIFGVVAAGIDVITYKIFNNIIKI